MPPLSALLSLAAARPVEQLPARLTGVLPAQLAAILPTHVATHAAPATVLAGFGFSLSLIVAIGAQNAFVLRQGLRREHVLPIVVVCAGTDALLITAGMFGYVKPPSSPVSPSALSPSSAR